MCYGDSVQNQFCEKDEIVFLLGIHAPRSCITKSDFYTFRKLLDIFGIQDMNLLKGARIIHEAYCTVVVVLLSLPDEQKPLIGHNRTNSDFH